MELEVRLSKDDGIIKDKVNNLVNRGYSVQGAIKELLRKGVYFDEIKMLPPVFNRSAPRKYMTYLAMRGDGICKIGKTINVKNRMSALSSEYGQPVTLLLVINGDVEKKFLRNTEAYFYEESNRKELRYMSSSKLSEILTGLRNLNRPQVIEITEAGQKFLDGVV